MLRNCWSPRWHRWTATIWRMRRDPSRRPAEGDPFLSASVQGIRNMRIGFLVWNQFQVAHSVEIARHFHDPDFIFIDRNQSALKDFDASWLAGYGAYTRFVRETALDLLDGEYDAIVAQFRPPVREPWRATKLVMHQY